MSQNFKIVLANVDKQTPNNVGFSDTITIKGDSKLALTSFNASFDINKLGQDILGQSFTMNLNESLYNSPKVVTIPDNTYFNETDLQIEMIQQLNKVFSAYEKDAPADQKRVFTGHSVFFINGNSSGTGLGGSVTKDKMVISLNVKPLVKHALDLAVGGDYTIDADGELTTTNTAIDFEHDFNASTLPDVAGLATDTYLMSGGGVSIQYNVRFNLKNQTLPSYFKLLDQNGDYMSLNYNTESRFGGTAPLVLFYVEKSVGGVVTIDSIGNSFYNYALFINNNSQNPSDGPWSQTDLTKTGSYFLWCVRDGKWIIVYYDANRSNFKEVYTNGIEYKIQDNYTFSKKIQQPSTKQVVYYPDLTLATLNSTASTTGATTLKTTFNFENALRLREIYSFGVVGQMQPENQLPSQYTPNGSTDFYPKQNFELACEIDTIKIKNYVGTKGNTGAGRKNIIAYFTPSSTISQSSFIYSFDPSTPIYLAVDSKKDIEFNSMNIRFINTYSNKTFSADTITCVLTNAP